MQRVTLPGASSHAQTREDHPRHHGHVSWRRTWLLLRGSLKLWLTEAGIRLRRGGGSQNNDGHEK